MIQISKRINISKNYALVNVDCKPQARSYWSHPLSCLTCSR